MCTYVQYQNKLHSAEMYTGELDSMKTLYRQRTIYVIPRNATVCNSGFTAKCNSDL